MPYPIFLLRSGKEHVLSRGHPWLFSQAIQPPKEKIRSGALADLYSSDGKRFLARGYYNSHSQIAFRILTRSKSEDIDVAFFEKRFRELLKIRQRFIDPHTNAFRLVFGESDGIPGLILDKYDKVCVIQIHTLGMELLKKTVLRAIRLAFHPETIFEKSDVGVRQLEGLKDMPVGHLEGKKLRREIEIREYGIPFFVNIPEGQKTGFFLDQRENRKALQRYAEGKKILNCFCYTGAFSVYASLAGAAETVNIDISSEALETAKRNFQLNKIPLRHHRFLKADVFKALGDLIKRKEKFDVVILDPPAFVKNQKSLKRGLAGYLFINERALELLPKGGILVSSSCSAHVTDEMLQTMLAMAASRTGAILKTLEIRHQPIDHPYNVHFPEGKYLKFYVMLKG